MDERVVVEVVGPDRWAQVRELRLAALAGTPDAFAASYDEERDQPERWWRDRLRREDAATFLGSVADTRGAAAAPVGLAVVLPTGDDATTAGLYAVWVAPDARGRGVGDALIAAAIEHARGMGFARLVLNVGDGNLPAVALYARHGFVPTGRTSTLPPPREHVTEHERALELASGAGGQPSPHPLASGERHSHER